MGGRWRPASTTVDPAHVAPPPDRTHRWRHPGLELLMAQSADHRPDLHVAMQSKDPVIATNAAILLSRQHDPATCGPLMKGPIIDVNEAIQHPPPIVEPLLRACRSEEANSWQRRAAIEAFSELNHPIAVVELRSLLDEHGRFAGDAARSYQPELHVELLHGLAHAEASTNSPSLGPDGEARFAAALASPATNVRREALMALADPRSGPLPANIVRHVGDTDSSVRRAALYTLTIRRHPEALELLRQALLDQDLVVRLSAVADLGWLGGPEALEQLRQMAAQGTELTRAAAVAALVEAGDDQIVSTAVADKSWRVRRALVPILGRPKDSRPKELAERLVADVNSDVARAAIDSIGHWPLGDAGPILLTAMEGRTYLTRKAAARQLTTLWPLAAEFEVEAAAARRATEMEQLRQKWQYDAVASPATMAPSADNNSPASASSETAAAEVARTLDEFERLVDQLDQPQTIPERAKTIQALVAFGPKIPDLLRQVAPTKARPQLPEAIYREVLPAVSLEFATIERLASSDVGERRQAADAIRTGTFQAATVAAADRRLSNLALERVVDLAIRESDPLVWGSIFAALADDDREPAKRLAFAGLSHPAPEVRRRACEHLGLHPDSDNELLLAKSLSDANTTVVEAAVHATGRLPMLDDPRPLEKILAADDHALRVEVAESLARFGFPSGIAALERLGYDAAPKVRRLAAVAMGRAPDRSFVPVLIHLLDDRPEVSKAALESLPRATGRDLPQATSTAIDLEQNPIRRWKEWYRADFAAPTR